MCCKKAGRSWIFKKKLAEEESFEKETGNAVMSVRGTKFQVKVYMNDNEEYVTEVVGFEGEVFLETNTGETASVLPGKTVYAIGIETPAVIIRDSEPESEEQQFSENTPTPTVTPTCTPTPTVLSRR